MAFTEISSFRNNGFVIIPNVLSPDDVEKHRNTINDVLSNADDKKRILFISDIFQNSGLTKLLEKAQFSSKILTSLNRIFKDEYYYVNDLQIQCSMFGIASGGWHVDCNSEVNLQKGGYLHDKDYSFAKIGVYLQDNTFDFGGAIDVIPKSHKVFKFFMGNSVAQYSFARFASKVIRLIERYKKISVPVKAGDAVIFDSRTLHRSSFPNAIKSEMTENEVSAARVSSDKINADRSKYSLYWEVGREEDAKKFLNNSCIRAMEEEILSSDLDQEFYYTDYLQYSFPNDYPEHYVAALKSYPRLRMLSLDDSKSNFFKTVLR